MATPASAFRRTRFPVPPGGASGVPLGGGGGQQGGGQQGLQQSQQAPALGQVQVVFPDASSLATRMLVAQPRSADLLSSPLFYWPTAGAMGVSCINTLDVPVRVEVHLNIDQNAGQPLKAPAIAFDVGAGEHANPTLDPQAGDPWAPYAWFRLTPLGVPTSGGIDLAFVRRSVI